MHRITNRLKLLLPLYFFCQFACAVETTPAKCVGKFCIGSPENKYTKRLFREYGPGQIKLDADDPSLLVHCYYDPRQKLWIELEISVSDSIKYKPKLTGLFVTSIPMCPTHFMPKKNFPDFVSEYGIKIGATESNIVGRMGTPKRRDDVNAIESKAPYLRNSDRYSSKSGSYRLVYDESPSNLLFNFYGLESGKLVSMWFAERE